VIYRDYFQPAWLYAVIAALFSIPGGRLPPAHAKAQIVLKVATVVPRGGESAYHSKKAIKRLEERTEGRLTARVYWGGVAGDDKTVLRKMRVGQIDASYLGLETFQYFVPQVMVLGAPNTFTTYQQVDAVRDALTPEFNRIAYQDGFKIMGWGDVGLMRIFSTKPIRKLGDFRSLRPWLYEESSLLKEFYRIVGCHGVPLGIVDIYVALRTGLVEAVWGSALVTVLLRWHSFLKHVSPPVGLIQGGFVLRRAFWDALEERDQKAMTRMAQEDKIELQNYVREYDRNIYRRILLRGMSLVPLSDLPVWIKASKRLRDGMVGRPYERQLLDRVEAIVSRYPDGPETPDGFR
jgi:TRAP-type C4-dicarboxylate transport system substrate-binding protein